MIGRGRRGATNAHAVTVIDFGPDVLGESQQRALTEEIGARINHGAGGGYHPLGDQGSMENTFGGALAVGPQGFVTAANAPISGHVFADPANDRFENNPAAATFTDPSDRIFLERLARRR